MGGPFPFTSYDCSCNALYDASGLEPCCNNCGRCQCTGTPCLFTPGMREITQKRIQNQVRVSESQYTDVLAAVTIRGGKNNLPLLTLPSAVPRFCNVNQSQASDRNKLHIQTRYVPGKGASSTKSSITRLRPGSTGPAGKNAVGVDVKHNSYDRYLGRLKAKSLGASWKPPNDPNTISIIPNPSPIQFERFSKINYGILGNGLGTSLGKTLCNNCFNS